MGIEVRRYLQRSINMGNKDCVKKLCSDNAGTGAQMGIKKYFPSQGGPKMKG